MVSMPMLSASDNPDPVANAIGMMVDHVHLIDIKVEEMCAAINKMGGGVCGKSLPSLGTRRVHQ